MERKEKEMPVTFDVSDVKVELVENNPATVYKKIEELFQPPKDYGWGGGPKVEKKSNVKCIRRTSDDKSINLRESIFNHGLVGAAFESYNKHHHLVIRPDDVWVTITTSLARYIVKHSENLRDVFVNHSGKKELCASTLGNINTANYSYLVDEITALIDVHLKSGLKEWVSCNFTTSTKNDFLVSQLVFMGAMKNFFSYKL